ncbi:MAG: hypothetical protein ABI576_20525 [Flavobacterium sp.]
MRKTAYLFILLLLFSCGDKKPYPNKISDFRPELQIQLVKLAKEKQLPSRDTIARNYLKDNCSKEELLKLLECDNPLLRVIAYITIVNRNEKDYFKILLEHLNDTAKVTYWYYEDAAGDFMVSDLLIREAADSRKLTRSEKNILVDCVLLQHLYLDTSDWMIQDIKPNEKYYSIIKQKSKLKNYRCGVQFGACYALSKFKKKEDLEYLKSIFESLESPCEGVIFKTIEQNPNQIYFPILKKYFNETIKKKNLSDTYNFKYYCRAVASYKNKESLSILTELLNASYCPDQWFYELYRDKIFIAIHKYNNPLYENLYEKLKPKMSEFVIEYLDKPDYSEEKTW